jgi:hypothetical protein
MGVAFAALRVVLKRGRGLRWLLSCLLAHPPTSTGPFLLLGPLLGCAFEAALPAELARPPTAADPLRLLAPFEGNKGHPHLISGFLIIIPDIYDACCAGIAGCGGVCGVVAVVSVGCTGQVETEFIGADDVIEEEEAFGGIGGDTGG